MEQTHLITPHSSCLCTFYHNGKANVMIIDNVETKTKYRNQGFATKLIDMALRMATDRGVDSVELLVNSDNIAAIHLYQKSGFDKTGKDHYRVILNER